MLAMTRHQKILALLDEQGEVKVSKLSSLFQVTEKTIREDLEKLDEMGMLTRIRGGAIPKAEESQVPPNLYSDQSMRKEKEAIALASLSYIQTGDIIALDSGTTTLEIAKKLPDEPITVVTNDLMIIRELALKANIRLVVPGGYRNRNLLVTQEEPAWVRSLNIHKLFLSTTGIHTEYGLTIYTKQHQLMKKVLMEAAKHVYCVADHTKFEKGALFTFATLKQVETIITDATLDPEIVQKYSNLGVHIELAPTGHHVKPEFDNESK